MNNKKGFTLVEILAVIAILAILAGIATPVILTVQKKIKNKMYDAKVKMVKAAANSYAFKKRITESSTSIPVSYLCTEGLLSVDENCNGTNCNCQQNQARNTSLDSCEIIIEYNLTTERYTVKFPSTTADEACKSF